MRGYFESGLAIDVILAVLAFEAMILVGWAGARDRIGVVGILLALLPGLCLLLALRAALTGAGWQWVALWLTASLPAHLLDLRRRLR